MSKKTITLTVSAVVVAIAIGAQFYTNHKVDQVLSNFPYSLDNQVKLHIAESNKNFFSRNLAFSLQNSEGKSTEIVHTKLKTLPFFITAESQLSGELTRQLNKDLNINLDKTTINSKFSPVGDYLQSDVVAEFRDFANKSQNLNLALHFLKTKEVQLNAKLSGFNYDNNSKLEEIEGEMRLLPQGANQYDLAAIELTAKNATLQLLNGENTQISLKNAGYKFNVTPASNGQKRDLRSQFSSDILRIANKNRTTEESQTMFGGVNLRIDQFGVPQDVNFYNEFKKIDLNNQSAKDVVQLLTAVLTQNEQFDGQLSVLSANAPKNNQPYFSLKNAAFSLKQNNKDLAHADVALTLNAENVAQTPEDANKQWQAQNFAMNYQLKDFNLNNELAFVPYYLALFNQKEAPTKDNSEFLRLKDTWAKATHGNSELSVKLGSLKHPEFNLQNVELNDKTAALENDQFDETASLTAEKANLPSMQVQLQNVKLNLPLKVNHYQTFAAAQFCDGLYAPLCYSQLSEATLQKYRDNQWKDLDLLVDNGSLTFELNTYPETKAYPVQFSLDGIISPAEDDAPQSDMFGNMEGNFTFSFAKSLIDETDEEVLKIKNDSPFWQYLRVTFKPEGKLVPELAEEGDNYQLKIERNDNETKINGKSLEDLEQEKQMEHSEDESATENEDELK